MDEHYDVNYPDPFVQEARLNVLEGWAQRVHHASQQAAAHAQHAAVMRPYLQGHLDALGRIRQKDPSTDPDTLIAFALQEEIPDLELAHRLMTRDRDIQRAAQEGRQQGRRVGALQGVLGEPGRGKPRTLAPAAAPADWRAAYADDEVMTPDFLDAFGTPRRSADPDSYRRGVNLMLPPGG